MSFSREIALIGEEGFLKLKSSCVAVLGLGGVGSYAAEAIARAGVGRIIAVDGDVIDATNINRQLLALNSTVGRPKAGLFKSRALDINPSADITPVCSAITCENCEEVLSGADYVIDAIDTVTCKADVAAYCHKAGVREISCMGTGNKLYTDFIVCDIFSTHTDPLARALRRLLREREVPRLKVVCSNEAGSSAVFEQNGKRSPASISYPPGVAGLIMAGECIRELLLR